MGWYCMSILQPYMLEFHLNNYIDHIFFLQPIICLDMWEVNLFSLCLTSTKAVGMHKHTDIQTTARYCLIMLISWLFFHYILQHAYYLDYKVCNYHCLDLPTKRYSLNDYHTSSTQNDREKYVNAFMDHLVSWNSVMARMARAEAFVNLGEPKIPIAWNFFGMKNPWLN